MPAPSSIEPHAEMLGNRLRKRDRHLGRWARREGVSCYRVYDRDIPEVPLQIDRYDDALHVAWLVPRADETDAASSPWLARMLEVACDALGVDPAACFTKLRRRQRGRWQYQKLAAAQCTRVVEEAGLKLEVNLSDYLDTGLFLDHRLTRAMVGERARGKSVLNLFAYTGAFTVHAAAGGATSTLTVDLSRRYLAWARRNLALNDLDTSAHRLLRADVLQHLAEAPRRDQSRFDLAIVDPPTHSVSKRMQRELDLQRDHPWLLERVRERVRPGGEIFFSTNYRKFRFEADALPGLDAQEITPLTTPEDFKRSHPHRCWRITVR